MFKTLRRMMKMHRIFIAQDLKKMMEYKIDFLTGAISFLLSQAINIAFLWIIFSQIPELKGWDYNEIIFIYGFSLLPKAIDHLFCDNLWMIGYSIVAKGEFDKYLTRPINPLFTVIVERFQVDALGELVVGIALIASTIGKVSIQWSVLNVLLFLLVLPFATLIYTSIKIITSALAFWIKRSGQITHVFYMVNDFAKYPTTIYNDVIRTVITYIIPFAFTAFYPASYFLTGENPLFNIGLTVVMSSVLMAISVFVWNKGVSAYESAGS
ncbi:MAG: ABC-2 family transporter protein [Acutalibacteraceae bacterium]|nr:ABC-2 family transporter protein [Acutalibacteraceae bacterium]